MNRDPLLLLILSAAGLPGCGEVYDGTACVDVAEDATTCPDAADVDPADLFIPFDCDGNVIRSVSGAGTIQNTSQIVDSGGGDLACCYDAVLVDPKPNADCIVGRPWREGEANVLAAVIPGRGWAGVGVPGHGPADPARAAAWAAAAAGEHASVPAFARLVLDLLGHGAPAGLLKLLHQAGLDEIDHAERCFALAGWFGGGALAPAPFPFGEEVRPGRSLVAIATDAVREGCLGETLAAVLARAAAEAAREPVVRQTLAVIADDEEHHAALSWQIVSWALRAGGEEVRAAVTAALEAPPPRFDLAELALRSGVDQAVLAEALRRGWARVVRPASRALLAA